MVYVTHDQVEAMTMGHRVAVLDGGILQQVDSPTTLYSRPANLFVAGFIGSPAMNLLEVDRGAQGLQIGGVDVPVHASVTGDLQDRSESAYSVGFRPEHLRIEGAGGVGMSGEVRVVETMSWSHSTARRTCSAKAAFASGTERSVTVSRPVGGVLSRSQTPWVIIHLSDLPGDVHPVDGRTATEVNGRAAHVSNLILLPVGFT